MNIKIGDVYSAHGFIKGKKIEGSGHYHFKIVHKEIASFRPLKYNFLGVKLDLEIEGYSSEVDFNGSSFWFNGDGIHGGDLTTFKFALRHKVYSKMRKA